MGRDIRVWYTVSPRYVSIHAPVWGATLHVGMFGQLIPVSIHAPVWGATGQTLGLTMAIGFNPRARMGRDVPEW